MLYPKRGHQTEGSCPSPESEWPLSTRGRCLATSVTLSAPRTIALGKCRNACLSSHNVPARLLAVQYWAFASSINVHARLLQPGSMTIVAAARHSAGMATPGNNGATSTFGSIPIACAVASLPLMSIISCHDHVGAVRMPAICKPCARTATSLKLRERRDSDDSTIHKNHL